MQYGAARLIEHQPIKVVAMALLPMPALFLVDTEYFIFALLSYSILLNTLSRLMASIVIEVIPSRKKIGPTNSFFFYILANAGLLTSAFIALLYIKTVALWLIWLDVFTTAILVVSSALFIRKTQRTTPKPYSASTLPPKKFPLSLLVGLMLIHISCLAQFGPIPVFFAMFESDMVDPQALFNLLQATAVVFIGIVLGKKITPKNQRILLPLGALSMMLAGFFYPQLSLDNHYSFIALSILWGLAIGILAPLCSHITIKFSGIRGTSINVLIIRISFTLTIILGLALNHYSAEPWIFQGMGLLLPLLGGLLLARSTTSKAKSISP